MASPDINWDGLSGRMYGYWIHPIGATFKDEPGNYIYAKKVTPGHWQPTYIGQTSNLQDRLADHEKESCARLHGATHVHAHTNSGGEPGRTSEERDLLAKWSPICNG